jgi:hypothetical protein
MPSPIQLIPAGYLGFFQAKTMGRNPAEAAEYVQPTLDMWKTYRAPFRRFTRQTANVSATGLGLGAWTVSVPQGFFWAIDYIHLYVGTAAGQAFRGAPAIFQNGTAEALWTGVPRQIGATELAIVPGYFEDPWIAAPGDAFGANVELLTAGPVTNVELKVVFTPMQA